MLPESLQGLPVLALLMDVENALAVGNTVLHAEPGAGKSTALPLALMLQSNIRGRIILLEPRRLAARMVAERLAFHLGEKVGQRIGLRMRSDTRVSRHTLLEVVTEGVLTRLLQNDPTLDGVALVIFDEFHERSLHADLGLALCLEVQQSVRDDLRLLLMSATLESDAIQSAVNATAVLRCEVRQHPVDCVYVGDSTQPLPQRVIPIVLKALDAHQGDVLVFLPGVAEINRTARLLTPRLEGSAVATHLLHGGISTHDQAKATAPASTTHRRVILATSLAETSITIDGVRVVVDSGAERRGVIDSSTGASRLETVTASQASASQRAGRAGRTSPGVCFRLWSEAGHARRPLHWQPEILRADLAPMLVELGMWGVTDVQTLPWLTMPPAAALARARDLLGQLGLWQNDALSARGRSVAAFPVHPRLGHMILWAALRGVAGQSCELAVLLEEQGRQHATTDLQSNLSERISSSMQRRVEQLSRLAASIPGVSSSAVQQLPTERLPPVSVILAQAYPDWIAQRRDGEPGRFQLSCGGGAVLDDDDALAHSPWLSVAQLGGSGRQLRIFKAMRLDIEQLENFSPELFVSVDVVRWDTKRQRVLAERRLMCGQLVVNAKGIQDVSDDDRARALLAGIQEAGISCLPWTDDCREWQARVQRMQNLPGEPEEYDWPDATDEALLTQMSTWLLPFLVGIGSMKALQQMNLYDALNAMLSYQQQSMLDEWLPRRYQVPSGSSIKVSYTGPGNPLLSVRLQEMLGCSVNPSIAKGRLPLKIALLSPALRPVQLTEDLVNFWSNSYPAVKKDMKGRYPKHEWPDDPLNASPTTRAKRRKSH